MKNNLESIKNKNVQEFKQLMKNDNVSICYFNENISKRPQTFLAKIIAIRGKNENKTVKIIRKFNDDLIFQTFFYSSPNIIFIKKIINKKVL